MSERLPRIVTFVIALHWAAVFGGLSAAVNLGAAGSPALARLSGLLVISDAGALAALALSAVLGVTALLFIWQMVTMLLGVHSGQGDSDEVARLAFASAAFALAVLTLMALANGVLPALPATLFAALAASFAAIHAERQMASEALDAPGRVVRAARQMAAGAAHNSLLTNLSGRNPTRKDR